jgi:hypothetical protein
MILPRHSAAATSIRCFGLAGAMGARTVTVR